MGRRRGKCFDQIEQLLRNQIPEHFLFICRKIAFLYRPGPGKSNAWTRRWLVLRN